MRKVAEGGLYHEKTDDRDGCHRSRGTTRTSRQSARQDLKAAVSLPSDPKYKEEVQVTLNTSRDGLYFSTRAKHYHVGMRVSVILGYTPNDRCNSTSLGKVVRIDRLEDGSFGIAVHIEMR
jgi:hypothetical protein